MALGKLKEKKGQKYATCSIVGCKDHGRIVARLGSIEICYCAHHRKKYGERVINALINAKFNFRLSRFMNDARKDLFMNYNSHLSEESKKAEAKYIKSKIEELKALEEEADRQGIGVLSTNPDKELDAIELD